MSEIYVSTDVEADGPIPGPNSMLSFASAAYKADTLWRANRDLLPHRDSPLSAGAVLRTPAE